MNIRNAVLALIAALSLTACASSNSSVASDGASPQFRLTQADPFLQDVLYFRGPISIRYQLDVTNPTDHELILRRLDLRTVASGAYYLNTGANTLNERIPPGGTSSLRLSVWGEARGGRLGSTEPVNIRGLAYLQGPNGRTFSVPFTQYLPIQ
jgi:hypothetical protein